MDPETWHVLIRNVSGLGLLAILAKTFSTMFNGPIVRAIAVKWFDLPVDEVLGQTDLRIEIALLRHQIVELSGSVQPEAYLNRPARNADGSRAGIPGPIEHHDGDAR